MIFDNFYLLILLVINIIKYFYFKFKSLKILIKNNNAHTNIKYLKNEVRIVKNLDSK